MEGQLPHADVRHVRVERRIDEPAMLVPAAARLGVTPDELAAALEAAGPHLCAAVPAPAGAGIAVPAPPAALFEAVDRQLGRGITAAQVQAAMAALYPADGGTGPARVIMRASPAAEEHEEHLRVLAEALGVTVDELEAALRSVGGLVVVRR